MGSLILGIFVALLGIAVFLVPLPITRALKSLGAFIVIGVGTLIAIAGGVAYNDAGYCTHIRTAFGNESYKCDLGWYFQGWGTSTDWPHYITVSHTGDVQSDGSAVLPPYRVRLADNWSGDVTQATRFGIPQDRDQFLKMARDFRSPERLITTTLIPSVTSSLDTVANLYTMEDYYAGGKRDEFKTEFADTVIKGRAEVDRIEIMVNRPDIKRDVAPSDSAVVQDTAEVGDSDTPKFITRKKVDSTGKEIRIPHGYVNYGIVVSTAILQQVDPDDTYEARIQERKDAASRRVIAREQRLEQEEQRLLEIAKGERTIAERQAQARTTQIQATTEAETAKKLALIAAERQREEARIQKSTSEIALEKAKIDAESKRVTADAEAYEKEAILAADGALDKKIQAYIETQQVWAEAFANRKVPTTIFGGSGTGVDSDVQTFMNIMTMNAAKQLQLDPAIKPNQPN